MGTFDEAVGSDDVGEVNGFVDGEIVGVVVVLQVIVPELRLDAQKNANWPLGQL